jgi:4-hydroxybenzoyl-CoA reductase subunit beta
MLEGQRPTPELIEAASVAAARWAKPLDNADLTINYRKQMAPVYVRRALEELLYEQ